MKITRESLLTLEAYEKQRDQLRPKAIARKNIRKVFLGDHVMMQFEDEQTIRYQIQEMLRAEKTFDEEGINDELDAYNPLVPDGRNWKATQMIEYTDAEERKRKLVELRGIERHSYIQIGGHEKVYAVADEDLPRENEEKTSAVHFMRFELSDAMAADTKAGAQIAMGVDHPAYRIHIEEIAPETQASLIEDLA